MSERSIGKVISVDSFRLYIRLDDDLKSLYKSGYEDIYEVARINSYVIIPIGSDRIVAMVTSVRAIDETELGKNKEAIFLTKSARYLVATMIGTIENSGKYIQGVYNYPILDNPVWYVTRQDLDNIFDQKQKSEINFEDDYYLPIGTSPSFSDYRIKINPDKFFGKHAAILGNTGSGKSCTFASIIQSMFEFDYNGKHLQNAHIVIFDTNGEYRQAFQGTKENPYKKLNEINAFHIDKNGMKVPFWFMNFADFDFLFEPTSGTQAPVFKRALGLAKNQKVVEEKPILDKFSERGILTLFDSSPDDIKKKKKYNDYGTWKYKEDNEILGLANTITTYGNQLLVDIQKALLKLGANNTLNDEKNALVELESKYLEYSSSQNIEQIAIEKNIDLPIWFNFQDLITRFFDEAINEQENSGNRLREFVSTLRLRLQSYLSDERVSQPLLLSQTDEITDALAKFISFILGDFCKVYKTQDTDLFTDFYNAQLEKKDVEKLETEKPSQVTIIDMSLLPFEVLETITGLIGRLILDFVSRFPENDRGKLPMVIALEEAQNYIPERNRGDRESIAKKVFERIAREGRKYGISLLVSSQRPSELSKTVLSQCNSFIIHRLQNPEDQRYVRQLVSAANEDILQQLPILPQQHVVIMGDAVRTPVQAKMNTANPRPNSNNPKFIENWTKKLDMNFPKYKEIASAWEKGEKYKLPEDKPDEVKE
ncbi:ATP-binding protein [Flavobacterium sp. NRK F7]|uniref:ATP-binding protein n=1 Tax=Flavobacterium sp. NRK F7 TaxID=2954930 RepID=UPI0020907ECB|nr:DUF87 domain-containing protein [Flavobacterium sp. NRK F7]MCO6163960.1 DUF87 domain-containing protein [Flavobacterium sp. NRK F7]